MEYNPTLDEGDLEEACEKFVRRRSHAGSDAELAIKAALRKPDTGPETLDSDGTFTEDDQGNWHRVADTGPDQGAG